MGIESDQLVFDYLSQVGDLAQRSGLPSAVRMRLVAELRARIDAQGADSVSGVRRVLARLGSPEAVVAAAGGGGRGAPSAGAGADVRPVRRSGARERLAGLSRRSGLKGRVPEPRTGEAQAASPPHLAGPEELGEGSASLDWWRVAPESYGADGPYGFIGPEGTVIGDGPEETVPGFVGGIEIPEMREQLAVDRPLSLEKEGWGRASVRGRCRRVALHGAGRGRWSRSGAVGGGARPLWRVRWIARPGRRP
ncbi:hypothetical protein [Streptomyces sp. MST-110588]|uniref:HAAS signaling domain-containing protein n=1 Tax=Streptomyces sp. MST-110588 TaxID=2833628 RepID=UPI003242A91B